MAQGAVVCYMWPIPLRYLQGVDNSTEWGSMLYAVYFPKGTSS